MPEVVNAKVRDHTDHRSSDFALPFQMRNHSGGHHLSAHDDFWGKSLHYDFQSPNQAHPGPLHQRQTGTHTVASQSLGFVRQRMADHPHEQTIAPVSASARSTLGFRHD